jgi:hypothetical protein
VRRSALSAASASASHSAIATHLDEVERVTDQDDADASDPARQKALEGRLGCMNERNE